jgi:hypothetical protein
MNKNKKIAVKQFQAREEASNLPQYQRTGTPKTFLFGVWSSGSNPGNPRM